MSIKYLVSPKNPLSNSTTSKCIFLHSIHMNGTVLNTKLPILLHKIELYIFDHFTAIYSRTIHIA